MKKIVFLAVLLFFNLSLISALDISLTKSSYYAGETLQAEIPDAFINPLTLADIGIYEGEKVHKATAETGLVKIDNTYHYYAVLPLTAGDYFMKIHAKHYEGVVESDAEITKLFKISSTNASYFSVNPGAISATSDFSITVTSYGGIQDATVEFSEADIAPGFTEK